ncbi:hypothetical protein OF83DRAFT_186584 [Amylostereum chailletii]|nr:hypothetical protein OF83DRAFT_186584 [Amylostereum chailletii]
MYLSSLFSSRPSPRAWSALSLAALVLPVIAQDRTTEKGEAQISDPTAECTAYYYAPVSTQLTTFPTIWQPATLLANDTRGQAVWNSIQASVPTSIQPKGVANNSLQGVTYNAAADPDCWWTAGAAGSKCTTPKLAGLSPDIASVPEPRTMGYGFDDGPNCSHNAFYDFLQTQNQKATMFFIGSNVMDWPLEAQRALADGHEICVHTWSHLTSFASQDAFAELWYTMQAIKLVTGVTPTCWRPPFGDVDDRIRAIAKGLNLTTIIWQYDSNDWRNGVDGITPADVDANYNQFIGNETSGTFNTVGGIMLTHELNNYTMQEAINMYPKLKAAFDHIVPIGTALNKTHPYVETNYTLPTFSEYVGGQTTTNSSSSGSSSNGNNSGSGQTVQGGSNNGASAMSVPHAGTFVAAIALFASLF